MQQLAPTGALQKPRLLSWSQPTGQGNGFEETIDLTQQVKQEDYIGLPHSRGPICALFMGLSRQMVERAGPGGEGYVIDHFNGDAKSLSQRFSDV